MFFILYRVFIHGVEYLEYPLDLDGSEVSFFESFGEGDPTRLFVGGLHGEEYQVTDRALKDFSESFSFDGVEGELVLCSLGGIEQEYVSTLKREYFESEAGQKLLRLINHYSPTIYLELHSYSNYSNLTDSKRIEKEGVPPLVDLGSGVLAGSISPFLRTKFKKNDFCFLLDLPKKIQNYDELLDILSLIGTGTGREEIVTELNKKYPEETEEMIKNYIAFYHGELSEKKDFEEI